MKRKIITLVLVSLVLCAQAGVRHTTYRVEQTITKLNSTEPAFYVVHPVERDGFMLISGDDRTEEVLFYADEGDYATAMLNPSFKWFMGYLQERVSAVNDSNVLRRATSAAVTPIEPLLDREGIRWDQDAPFNLLCPTDPKDNTRSYIGCVATAAAQILRYWKHPAKTNGGIETYGWERDAAAGESSGGGSWWGSWFNRDHEYVEMISLNYDTIAPYNWDLMRPSYLDSYSEAEGNEVARLMYHVAVAAHMDFGGDETGGSGALLDTMGIGLEKHFDYHYTTYWTKMGQYYNDYYRQSGYAATEDEGPSIARFTEAFNADLEAGKPILMAGYDISEGLENASGHAFVVDGRDSEGNFHFNFGWSGVGNGYSPLDVISTTMGASYGETGNFEFGNYIDAIIGLAPNEIDTVHVTQVKVNPTSMTLRLGERSPLSVVVYPADATVKSCTYTSNNEAVAIVTNSGMVRAVAPGETEIIVTSRDRGEWALCHVTVLNEALPFVGCDDYSYTFTYDLKPVAGANTFGDYDWTVSLQKGRFSWDSSGGLGFQIGSSSTAAQRASFITENTTDCLVRAVTVNSAKNYSGDGQLAVYIGDEQIGETIALTGVSTDYTFVNTEGLRGAVEIRFTNTAKAMYIKSIQVKYDSPTGLDELNGKVVPSAVKVLQNGHILVMRNGKIYNMQGQTIK